MNVKLLNIDANPKTVKGQKLGYMTAILYLAPFKLSGYQVCPMAELAGCVGDCLNTAGRGGMAPLSAESVTIDGHTVRLNSVQRARIARTRWFFENRESFMDQLFMEIHRFVKKARRLGLIPVVRLNGTSDIRWENVFPANGANNIFQVFPEIQFYDYTKIPNRKISAYKNYHLTFSNSARPEFVEIAEKARQYYGDSISFVSVFKAKVIPTGWVNGDESDLRFLDPAGSNIGLIAKGRARKSNSGFCFDHLLQ
jgi:hypothetical protein